MWFQIHIARDRGDEATIDRCVRLIKRHMEHGWDSEFGGLLLAVDADGNDEIGWNFPDTKIWWPQVEAMYALLLAHKLRGESWGLSWYWKVHEIAFRHYPNWEHGEWTQKMDREFRPITDVVALPVKDPFHLPRVLIHAVELLQPGTPE
jgi:N-acylglucosamine 2-epimerase